MLASKAKTTGTCHIGMIKSSSSWSAQLRRSYGQEAPFRATPRELSRFDELTAQRARPMASMPLNSSVLSTWAAKHRRC